MRIGICSVLSIQLDTYTILSRMPLGRSQGCVSKQAMRPANSTEVFDGPTLRHHVRIFEGIDIRFRTVYAHCRNPLPLIRSTDVVQPTVGRTVLIGWLCGEIVENADDMIGGVGS